MPKCYYCPAYSKTSLGFSTHLLFYHGKYLEPCKNNLAKKRCGWRIATNRWNKNNPEKRKENARISTRKYREKIKIDCR